MQEILRNNVCEKGYWNVMYFLLIHLISISFLSYAVKFIEMIIIFGNYVVVTDDYLTECRVLYDALHDSSFHTFAYFRKLYFQYYIVCVIFLLDHLVSADMKINTYFVI